MNKLILFCAILIASCNSNEQTPIDHTHEQMVDTAAMVQKHSQKLYADVVFDDKYDLSCGMPVTAGLTDTARYKGKLYGFCSPECKEDFKKNAEKLLLERKSK